MGKIVLYCQPGAKQTRHVGKHNGMVKVQIKAPPVDGAANKALITYVAAVCGVSKSSVTIELGESARTKRVQVVGMSDSDLLAFFDFPGLCESADVISTQ